MSQTYPHWLGFHLFGVCCKHQDFIYLSIFETSSRTGFSLVAASYSLTAASRLLIAVGSLVVQHKLWNIYFSSGSAWGQKLQLPGARAQAQ